MARPALRTAILTAALAAAVPAAAWAQSPTRRPPRRPRRRRSARAGRTCRSHACDRGRARRATRLRVRVVVQPYVGFQQVAVRILRDGRRRAELKAPVAPGPGGRGVAHGDLPADPRRPTGRARGARAPRRSRPPFRAGPRHVTVRALAARLGDRGRPVRILQRALPAGTTSSGARGTLRRPDGPRGDGLPQGRRPGAHRRRHARRLPAPRARPGRLPRPLPAARQARRGRPLAAGPRARPGRRVQRIYPTSSGAPGTPTVLGHFRVYLKTPGHERQGHGRLELLHPRVRDPRLRLGARSSTPATDACGCRCPTRASIFGWLKIGDRVDVYP